MLGNINNQIKRHLNAIRQAFRGVLKRVNSTAGIQTIQGEGLAGEKVLDAEFFQHYGLTSNPPAGTAAIIVPLNGVTAHSVIIATEHESYRLTGLKSGEVALYTDEGAKIVLKRGRLIETDCDVFKVNCKAFEVNASEKTDVNTPMLTASAQVTAKGKVTGKGGMSISGGEGGTAATLDGTVKVTQDVTASGVSLVNHVHRGDSGGTTSIPTK